MARPSSLTLRQPTGFPDKIFVKLKYAERLQVAHAAGIAVEDVYSGNSCFDPSITGGSYKPYGFNQWTDFYRYYTVYGSRIKVTPIITTNTNMPLDVAVVPSTVNTIVTSDIADPVETNPYAKWVLGGTYRAGVPSNAVRNYMSTAKIWGVSPVAVRAEDAYAAAVGTNPVDQWFWIVVTQPLDEATAVTCYIMVEITYYVEFSVRKNLARST